jgi:hypothetical protein
MSLQKVYETPEGIQPSIIVYRNKPDQLFVQFQEEGMSVNDFTVDDMLLQNNDLHSVHDFEHNVDKMPTRQQRDAFQIAREWLIDQK